MTMKIGDLVRFHEEYFFEGAVQLRWTQERPEHSQQAARAFVFHGPHYHGASEARQDGIEGGYRLKDSASLLRDLLDSIQDGLRGEDRNPYWLVVAGYGAGKSHLALTCATLLDQPDAAIAQDIIQNVVRADQEIGQQLSTAVAALRKPVLVLSLDGMAGFHLGNALSQATFAQLRRHGVDTGAIRALSPRFQTAEQFVERNFDFRAKHFAERLPGLTAADITERLRNNDEAVYSAVDALFNEANGAPIPVIGQESAQELLNTLCEVYCGPGGDFSSVLILFDEFGRYLEYAAEKPQLAGDAALQQLFQGVQDNGNKVRFLAFIQYELKAYLQRFSGADLRQLQRYITRFDAAEKWYLSTNLETLFAHMIGKEHQLLAQLWNQTDAARQGQLSWQRMRDSLPGFSRFPVWNEAERFAQVIVKGCWPLHPLATWFLTRQRDIVQSRSALTFIKDVIERIAAEDALSEGRLRQVSAAELTLRSLLPEMIAAERETGATVAETLQALLEKFHTHLDTAQRLVLAGIAVLEKTRIGRQTQDAMQHLLSEATALSSDVLHTALTALSQDLGAVEWNADLGHYELIADASTRGQFQQWLRTRRSGFGIDAVRDLFIRRGAKDSELSDIETDFAQSREISSSPLEWRFEASFAHAQSIASAIHTAFQEWQKAISHKESKGKLIYLYLHPDDTLDRIEEQVRAGMAEELARSGYALLPIWVIALVDRQGIMAEHLSRLHLFEEQASAEEREKFRRFIPDECARSRQALQNAAQNLIRERIYWVAGCPDIAEQRLKSFGSALFARVYPQTLPFPFDGFNALTGNGPADCAQLTRSLIAQQVDAQWLQAQPTRLRGRAQKLLATSWKALQASGKLSEPQAPAVRALYQLLQERHQQHPKTPLAHTYRRLLAPPYGMHSAAAGVMLGLLIGLQQPPRRLEQNDDLIAAGDWLHTAFPAQRGQHVLSLELLEKTTLCFLSEDSEQRWRTFMAAWETERNYQKKVNMADEAERRRKSDPLPESLEGNYKYLLENAQKIRMKLHHVKEQISRWQDDIERAQKDNAVGQMLKAASALWQQLQTVRSESCWPDDFTRDCENLLQAVRQMVSQRATDWIEHQYCNTESDASAFRQRMDKAIESLKQLDLKSEAQRLEERTQAIIFNAKKRQQFQHTLDESDDYPRQPQPTESTPVRDLRDGLKKGDDLLQALREAAAKNTIMLDELNTRSRAIEQRQLALHNMLKQQRQQLQSLYTPPVHYEGVREALARAQRLRGLFVGTADASEVADLIVQLEHILEAVAAWDSGAAVSVERLSDLLQQSLEQQSPALERLLAEQGIEPVWAIRALLATLIDERIAQARRRSADWLRIREPALRQIDTLDQAVCRTLEQELTAAPAYLAQADRVQVQHWLDALRARRMQLEEQARQARITAWMQRLPALDLIKQLDEDAIVQALQTLHQPPDALRTGEQATLKPITAHLTARLDQLSMDDIIHRIERLPDTQQRQLLALLSARLGVHAD